MKTLRGNPIEGDLLKLYQYALAPDGNVTEALDMAEANGLKGAFEDIMHAQYDDPNRVFGCISKWVHSEIVQHSEAAPDVRMRQDCTLSVLEKHLGTGVYEFEIRIQVVRRTHTKPWERYGDFATKKEAERLWFAASGLELASLNKDGLPYYFFEHEYLRKKTEETEKRVAVAIQGALHELKNTPITSADSIDARNIVVKTNLDNYPQITYIDNFKAVFAH